MQMQLQSHVARLEDCIFVDVFVDFLPGRKKNSETFAYNSNLSGPDKIKFRFYFVPGPHRGPKTRLARLLLEGCIVMSHEYLVFEFPMKINTLLTVYS